MATSTVGTSRTNSGQTDNTRAGTTGDIFRQIAVVAGFLGVIIGNTLSEAVPIGGKTSASISNALPVLITPANFAFAIWGLIWLGLGAYAVYQALPVQRTNPTLAQIAPWFILTCVCNVGWLVLFHFEQFVLSCFVIALLTFGLTRVYLILGIGRKPASTVERLCIHLPFSLYLGWLSVATIVNIAYTLYYSGFVPDKATQELLTVGMLVVATALGAIFAFRHKEIALVGVLIWAFSAIAVGRATDSPAIPGVETSTTISTAAWALVVVLVVLVIASQLIGARTNRPIVTGRRAIQ